MKFRFWSVTALVICAMTAASFAADAPDPRLRILPSSMTQASPAIERTPQQMDAFDATNALSGATHEVPFRPTMSAADYAAMKNVSGMMATAKPGAGALAANGGNGSVLTKFGGPTECDGPGGCWLPPDVSGTIGKGQFVSVSNDMIEIRSRTGLVLKTNSLNGFFGYSTTSMFDPRVQYDEQWQRWVVTADSFQDASNNQIFGIAISKTNSPTGAWWIYFLNVKGFDSSGGFYDYPMLGMSQDAVIFTANEFSNSNGVYSTMFAVAKAKLYNGFGFSVPLFLHLQPTLQPSHQLTTDGNVYSWLMAGNGHLVLYALYSPANPTFETFFGPYSVSGDPGYSGPPAAPQPGSCAPSGANLDSLDGRFQNTGTENGDSLYQTHTVGSGIFPIPRWYHITGLLSFAPALGAQGAGWNYYYHSGSSYDFNPSIVADASGRFGVGWSYTDTNVNASLAFADNNGTNPGPSTGTTVFTSASCYTGVGTNRWGDYSQTSYDPGTGTVSNLNSATFWTTNETIPSANFWSTEIAKMKY